MILKALADYQHQDVPPLGYAARLVGFSLRISADAQSSRMVALHEQVLGATGGPTSRLRGRLLVVPDMTRSNNPPPILGVDTAEFVLARAKIDLIEPNDDEYLALFGPSGAKAALEAQKRNDQFRALLDEFAAESGLPDPATASAWYSAGRPGLAEALLRLTAQQRAALATDRVEVVVDRRPLANSLEAQRFWARKAFSSKGSGRNDVCLVCGNVGELVATLPLSLTGSLVPGTSKPNVALASSNFAAAQRNARGKGLRSIPICASCGARAAQNFNILASDSKHRWGQASDADGLIWWESGGGHSGIDALTNEKIDAARVRELLDSVGKVKVEKSRSRAYDTSDRFYALTYSGNAARFVVRSWLDLPLKDIASNVRSWFRDTESLGQFPFHSIRSLAMCAGPIGRGARPDSAPHGLQGALLEAAVTGRGLPQQLLTTVLARARAEHHLRSHSDKRFAHRICGRAHVRAGLIRLILNRSAFKEAPMASHLDDTRDDKPYLYGRIFAEREALQRSALGTVGAGISDRFFTRASTNPVSVEGTLARLEEKHLKTLIRTVASERKSREAGIAASKSAERRLGALHDRAGDPPRRMTDVEQGAWLTGYYQQRQYNIEQAVAYSTRKQQDAKSEENQ